MIWNNPVNCANACELRIGQRITSWLLPIMLVTVFLLPGHTEEVPARMTHIIVEMGGTDIHAASFAAKPKVYWRASNRYCRVDEEPDTDKGIYGEIIVNEPDAWLVNLADHTAKHVVDHGPTFNCRLPIFTENAQAMKSKIAELEFGRELEFFRSNGAKPLEGPPLDFKVNYYDLIIGDTLFKLVERADTHTPIVINLIRAGRVIEVHYTLWDDRAPFRMAVFAKPTGVKIQEID